MFTLVTNDNPPNFQNMLLCADPRTPIEEIQKAYEFLLIEWIKKYQ